MVLDYPAIGKRIRAARLKCGLTQETMANKIGVTPQHVSNIETGNSTLSLTALISIANLLKVSADDLLCDNVLMTKVVFDKEAQDVLSDCSEYEVRVLVDVMRVTKDSMRKVKMFQKQNEQTK